MAVLIAQTAVSLGLVALNMIYWWLAVTRWQERFRRHCEDRYGVVITHGGKGSWHVEGDGPWHRRLAIELLQLVYFMGVMLVWICGVVGVVVVLWALS